MALSSLDTRIAQAVYRARLVEAGLHDEGPWFIEWCGVIHAAIREITDGVVTFKATFEPPEEPESLLSLRLRGHVAAARVCPDLLAVRTDQPVEIEWKLSIGMNDFTFIKE